MDLELHFPCNVIWVRVRLELHLDDEEMSIRRYRVFDATAEMKYKGH